ncbi:MAG: CIA30 family protein [Spirulinaceae cyanobacterium RM2_2_10]|nr:CIA30 family protein [Spirulinaceae cyanobacterium RM2_2_10]
MALIPAHPDPSQALGTVLVVGASQGLGTVVAAALRSRYYPVRYLDSTQWQPETDLDSVQAVVYCAQEAAIALDDLLAAAGDRLGRNNYTTLFDFQYPTPNLAAVWGAVDDVVMGGVSESDFYLADSVGIFAGNVSTANSGGFASVRTRNFEPALDLSNYQGFRLRVRGDGQRYKFIARCEGRWDGAAYCYSFDTVPGEWREIEIPFTELIPVFRARTLTDAAPFDASRTHAVQLMLSKFEYDGALNPHFTPGHFELRVATLGTYGGATTAKLIWLGDATQAAAVRASGLPYCVLKLLPTATDLDALSELAIAALELPEACNQTASIGIAALQGTADWRSLFSQS